MNKKSYVSTVKWRLKINKIMRELRPIVGSEVKITSDFYLRETVKNCSGPSINVKDTNNPAIGKMPIPRREKNLVRSIKRQIVYSFYHAVYSDSNIAPYNKLVHDGNRSREPRRFIGNVKTMYGYKMQHDLERNIKIKLRRIGLK